jgi:hypothetical protein
MDPYTKELADFVDSIDVADVPEPEEVTTSTTPEVADVWQTIADAVDNWSIKILDAESLHSRSESFRCAIANSLHRLQLDGFVLPFELSELQSIADKWVRLLHALSSYGLGSTPTTKEDIISLLVGLYDLKQLDAQTFIYCCTNL